MWFGVHFVIALCSLGVACQVWRDGRRIEKLTSEDAIEDENFQNMIGDRNKQKADLKTSHAKTLSALQKQLGDKSYRLEAALLLIDKQEGKLDDATNRLAEKDQETADLRAQLTQPVAEEVATETVEEAATV